VAPKKLTPGEIKNVVEKIRKKYDEYIYKYFKPKTLREAFEDRYIKALRKQVDISSFLLAEISAIEELTKREEERVASPQPLAEAHVDIADKVIEENRKRIEKYPDVPFHKDAGPEVRKLLGALNVIADEHWHALNIALRNTAYSMTSVEMLGLDSRLRYLASVDKDGIPQFLIRYVSQLKKFPRNYALLEREEKEYILEAAFFLNDLIVILERVKRVYKDIGEEDLQVLDAASTYVWEIITDFRLKEFRKKREWNKEGE
jgi:hypothetical protein